ncbi:hypothetical protein CK910_22865 [Aeromonas sp. CA23]|uniref:EAL domain-containing protein n=1 Tax=Aeromonas sp. CA23 TaxID=2033032 RepID=UPI000BFBFD1A|nr:EAL domain-containing protein [Aeromonas sp. CA23]ATM01003.1 hypothetical protein CK910_22865 [Aeromonas sp. CA23]
MLCSAKTENTHLHTIPVMRSRLQPIMCLKNSEQIGYELLSKVDGVDNTELYFTSLSKQDIAVLVMKQVLMMNQVNLSREVVRGRCFINVRIESLADSNLIMWICRNCKIPLSLEVDYQYLILNSDVTNYTANLALLRSFGHQIWLDDFLCDFSQRSRETLSVVDWDGIKVDRSILWDLCYNEMELHHIVNCCRGFTDCVLIEGVETDHHVKVCQYAGVDYAQGFHWLDRLLSS